MPAPTRQVISLSLLCLFPAMGVFVGCGGDDGGAAVPATCRVRARAVGPARSPGPTGTLDRINRFVVIYLENRSFDHLFGEFPGARGLVDAQDAPPQVDAHGRPYVVLPIPDDRFARNLPNAPFAIEDFVPATQAIPDLVHRFYQQQQQIHGGRMDKFVAVSDAGGLTMGFYRTAKLPLYPLAQSYTLCDHFFAAAFGGSFLNHQWLVSAASPVFENAPAAITARHNPDGSLAADGSVSTDGCYVINNAFSAAAPTPGGEPRYLVPAQSGPTIGDRLSAKGVDWAWYAGGWNDAVAGHASALFQFHHQPFLYFADYGPGTPGRAQHLRDEKDFLAAAKSGTLPAVSFVKPLGALNEHPGYSVLTEAEAHAVALVAAVSAGPQWADTAIIITYDENGGFWDHVAPPAGDEWGPGTRVPTLVVSPFARRNFVDHTVYDTTSILATFEHRFGLDPLGARDAAATDLLAAFDFSLP